MSFYIKWEQNYISKLHSMMTYILMFWFKESSERRKTSFLKQIVENVDLHKAVLKKNDHTRIARKIRFCSSFKSENSLRGYSLPGFRTDGWIAAIIFPPIVSWGIVQFLNVIVKLQL